MDALLSAFSRPGALEERYRSPFGLAPGAVLIELRIVDELVHGWDVARAAGQPVDGLPEDLATTALAFSAAQRDNVDAGPNPPFAASKPVADGAPAIDRLAVLLGRTVPGDADPG